MVFCSQWAVEYTRAQAEVAWSELLDRVTYFTTCASGRDSLEVWEQVNLRMMINMRFAVTMSQSLVFLKKIHISN